jgi:hypothetical protein
MRDIRDLARQEGTADGTTGAAGDNVVTIFAPRSGMVAHLIEAASGPPSPRELAREREIRAAFRSSVTERSRPTRRHHRLAPIAIAAGSIAALVGSTAGLSAAADLPPAASHVVAQVFRQVGINVAPHGSATAAAPARMHFPTSFPAHAHSHAGTKADSSPKASTGQRANTGPSTPAQRPNRTSSPGTGTRAPSTHTGNSTTVCKVPTLADRTIQTHSAMENAAESASQGQDSGCAGGQGGTGIAGGTGPGGGSTGGGTGKGLNHGGGSGKGKGTGKGLNHGGGSGKGKGTGRGKGPNHSGGSGKGSGSGTTGGARDSRSRPTPRWRRTRPSPHENRGFRTGPTWAP